MQSFISYFTIVLLISTLDFFFLPFIANLSLFIRNKIDEILYDLTPLESLNYFLLFPINISVTVKDCQAGSGDWASEELASKEFLRFNSHVWMLQKIHGEEKQKEIKIALFKTASVNTILALLRRWSLVLVQEG